MANRTMAAKAAKYRRQKRAWAKTYGRSNHTVPNRGVLNEYKERALGLGVDEFAVDELIRTQYNREAIYGFTPGQKEVHDLMKEMRERVPELMSFTLLDNAFYRATCNFNAERSCWSISVTDKRLSVMRTSIEYGTKELAIELFHQGRLRYASKTSVASPAAG